MLVRFLRLFHSYLAVESELSDVAGRLILAEDQARLWHSRADSAEAREQKALGEKDHVFKMVCNAEAIRSGSLVVPFPDVYVPMPEPVRNEDEETPEPRKRRASEVVKEMEREFAEAYGASLDRELAE